MVLLASVLVLLATAFLPVGTGEGQVSGPAGTILIALTGSLPAPSVGLTPGFQSLSFNVLAVKLHPSTDPAVFQNQADPNWTTIPVAPGVGLNNIGANDVFTQLFTLFNLNPIGPNPAGAGTGPSELQVDITQIQTVPQLFNSFLVPPTIRSSWCSMAATPAPSFRPAWKLRKVCSRDVSRRRYHWSIHPSS